MNSETFTPYWPSCLRDTRPRARTSLLDHWARSIVTVSVVVCGFRMSASTMVPPHRVGGRVEVAADVDEHADVVAS
jgi:hypothetical protein